MKIIGIISTKRLQCWSEIGHPEILLSKLEHNAGRLGVTCWKVTQDKKSVSKKSVSKKSVSKKSVRR